MQDTTTPAIRVTVQLVEAGGPGGHGGPGDDLVTTWRSDAAIAVRTVGGDGPGLAAELDPSATVSVVDLDAAGTAGAVRQAISVTSAINAYGVTVETHDYGLGVTVERHFDDDDRLREVVLRCAAGAHRAVLWPDGARTLHWELPGRDGRRHWDAAGHLLQVDPASAG